MYGFSRGFFSVFSKAAFRFPLDFCMGSLVRTRRLFAFRSLFLPLPVRGKASRMGSNKAGVSVAVTQFCATGDKKANFEVCSDLVRRSAAEHAEVVFLPEGFDYIEESKKGAVEKSESLDGETIGSYRRLAAENRVWLFLGGFHERVGEDKISNAHVVIDSEGKLRAVYRKIHLFDVDIPEKGVRLMESSYCVPGQRLVEPVSTPAGRVGLAICYDMRFAEMAVRLRGLGAEILTFPSAFTVKTGEAHWETLLRARAIENQCYVVAAAQVGQHNAKRASYGHAVVVDPWGKILVDCGSRDSEPRYELVDIDLELVRSVRKSMPVAQHRREAVYDLPEVTGDFRFPEDDGAVYAFGQVEVPASVVFLVSRRSYAFVNKKCVRPGHVLVAPIRKALRFADLSQDEVADVFCLAKRVEFVMESIHGASSSTVSVQDGPDAGQTIRHFHVHVIPRTVDDFPENDNIYKELAEHDKGPDVVWREPDDMRAECVAIRRRIAELFPDQVSGGV